jgi:hypothetical protein
MTGILKRQESEMKTHKFAELRDKMSPEAKAESDRLYEQALAETRDEVRTSGGRPLDIRAETGNGVGLRRAAPATV